MLIIQNLTKKFGTKTILDDVSLEIKKGEIHVLLGTSGVGKSTLLRILCGLELPDSGTIELDGKLIDPKTISTTHSFGMVFQHFNLFGHLSVINNISFPLQKILGQEKRMADHYALELLGKYNLADKAQSSVHTLSGGQKQRLAIARTIALRPHVVCMDEPTSALDPLLTTHIATTIQELAQEGYPILIATHDTLLLEKLHCTIHLMKQGKIIETATSHAYKQNPATYQVLDSFIKGHHHS